MRLDQVHHHWDQSLAPHNTVRADHQQDGHLVPRLIRQLVGEAQGLAEKQALSRYRFLSNPIIHLNRESVFLKPSSQEANKRSPDKVASIICAQIAEA